MYQKNWKEGGLRFTQEMDLSTDTAKYTADEDGRVLMIVDSSGRTTDGVGNHIGNWHLNGRVWEFESFIEGKEGTHKTPFTLLFDKAEPYMVGKLFGLEQTA